MNKETKYEFRKRIDEVHRPDVRSAAECRKDDETANDEEGDRLSGNFGSRCGGA
mgnify:CR=1 FL=1